MRVAPHRDLLPFPTRRSSDLGSRVTEAAIYGTSEVGLAVFATTMTIVAVFLPLVFLTGMAGVLFSSLGALVTITVIVSPFTALTFVPMLSSTWLQSTWE